MVTEKQIERINELARKSRSEGLTAEESAEQQELRQIYINSFRNNMKSILDNTVIQNPDGTKHKLVHHPKPRGKN
ncbi:MAG: DUF896 domain-containing protein [Eubacteriales bacterium]